MEYENQKWLYSWLNHRVKYQLEERDSIQKSKDTVKNINFSWHNLKGKLVIENFPKLTCLNLGNNELSELEIINCPELKKVITSHNKLNSLKIKDCKGIKELYTHNNQLKDLDVSEITNLKILSYSDNPLEDSKKKELDDKELPTEGDTEKDAVKTLDNDEFVDNPDITEIDISNEAGWGLDLQIINCPKLTHLTVDNCKLEYLDIIDCPNLKTLSFRFNNIKEIDLSELVGLENLYCSSNKLKELDLTQNLSLKNLLCDNNSIGELEVKHLTELESLYCFKCNLEELDCSKLEKLKELYCANSNIQNLDVDGCKLLEWLDCAENVLATLELIDFEKLENVSCKENQLDELVIEGCDELSYLDFSRQRKVNWISNSKSFTSRNKLTINNSNNLKKVFHDKDAIVPDWETISSLELLVSGEIKEVEIKDEETRIKKKQFVYLTEEIDFIALRNIDKINNILNNPNDYSLEYLLKLDRKSLYGIPSELKEKLVELIKQKNEEIRKQKEKEFADELRRRFGEKYHFLGDEQEKPKTPPLEKDNSPSEEPSELPTPQDTPTSQQSPSAPKENDDKKTILALQQKITELETKIRNLENDKDSERKREEIRNEILSSGLSEDKKQELLKLLERKLQTSEKQLSTNTTSIWPWIIGGSIVISVGLFFLLTRNKKNKKMTG